MRARFGGGEGAFVQHLEDDGRGGTRCLPVSVFESVLTESGGTWMPGVLNPGHGEGETMTVKTVTQQRCPKCGVVYSEAAFPAHRPDEGACAPPESLGLARGPGHVWCLPGEVLVKVTCPRCGVTFSEAAHQAHRPEEASACMPAERIGLVRDDAAGVWHLPHE